MSLFQPQPRKGVYYGWLVVAVIFLLGVGRAPLTGFLFGVFIKPMSEDFGWSRALFTGATTAGTLVGGVVAYSAGRIVDRYGPRVLMVVSTVVVGGVYLALAGTTGILFFYVAWIVGRAISQSASSEAMYAAVVSKWFVRLRGRAIGLSSLGGPLGGAGLALLAQFLIISYGWRAAWLAFGVMTWVVVLAPTALFLRRTPEDMGLHPDGDSVGGPSGEGRRTAARPVHSEHSWPFAEALHTRAFWLLTLVGFLGSVASTSVAFHLVPHFTDLGIDVTLAVAANSVYTLAFAAGILLWGFVIERANMRVTFMVTMAVIVVGIVLVMLTRSAPTMFLTTAVYGLGQGGWFIHCNTIWAIYYGRRHLGAIRGLTVFFQMGGNAVGPLFSALVFDAAGSYQAAFIAAASFAFLCILLLALTRKPVPRAPAPA